MSDLLYCVACGDLRKIENLVNSGININYISESGLTPLFLACEIGCYITIKFLLEFEKIDFLTKNKSGLAPIQEAAHSITHQNMNTDILTLFLAMYEKCNIPLYSDIVNDIINILNSSENSSENINSFISDFQRLIVLK